MSYILAPSAAAAWPSPGPQVAISRMLLAVLAWMHACLMATTTGTRETLSSHTTSLLFVPGRLHATRMLLSRTRL